MKLSEQEQTQTNNPTQTPAEEKTQGFLPVLKNYRFLTLWSGQIFSQLADKVYLVLMISIIASHFQRPDQTISGWVSAIMIAFTIPAILFGSLAGVYVDRWSKKLVLVGTNLVRGLLVWSVPFLLYLTEDLTPWFNLPVGFWCLLMITFLVSTLTQFFAPAEQTAIPLLVKRNNLLPANSLYTTTMMASVIIGFAVGEPLLQLTETFAQWLGLTWEFSKEIVVGSGYAIAGLVLIPLNPKETVQTEKERPHVFQDIWDGIQYLRQNYRVRNAMIQLIILFCIFAALAVLAVRLAETLPNLESDQFGFILAVAGVGMAIGAAFLGNWGESLSRSQLGLWGSFGMGSALVGLAFFTANLGLAFALTILLGFFASLVGIPMQTTIQEETPESKRGKVFGLQNNAVNIALSLPLALASVAETVFGLEAVLLGLAASAIVGGLLTWCIAHTGENN
ncbi:MFS transporter [Dactylococcopsis salina]|uniref:Arabinose efflux permease family protein n=1 Tax=Dactylococcopsis salina (strain PCC 8305) TaxID=13035 RepID=K9YSE2_DACS8|nr:MFS transporter [Dactylococcopsis salina]AFZ49038.1 arabinose efflux permease family protein [Dactylococcopsis salina PCC 8305]